MNIYIARIQSPPTGSHANHRGRGGDSSVQGPALLKVECLHRLASCLWLESFGNLGTDLRD